MKRFLLVAFLACMAVVALGWWYGRHRLLGERRVAARQADAVAAALKERIDTKELAGQERRWGEVLAALAARCDVPLHVNDAEAKSMGVDSQTRVYVPAGVFPLGELLDEITGPMDLGWRRSGGSIELTSVSEAESGRLRLVTRVYPLPAANAAGETIIDDAQWLTELITTHIVPESWEEVGGQGVIEPAGGAVVVRQTDAIHGLIREFLSQMESSRDSLEHLAQDRAEAAEEQRIARALAEKDSVDLHDTPLDGALQSLMDRHGLRFQFSDDALSNGAANPAIPMTVALSNVSLQTILHEILAQQQLTYVVRDGALEVTTMDAAQSHLPHAFYDVRDLVETGGRPDFDSLIELITTTVEPDSWDDVGGPGTITEMGDRWLVVSQTQDIQQKVRRILARVRATLEPGVDPAADALLEPVDDVAPAVVQALAQEVTLKYDGRTLAAVCRDLSQRLAIPVLPRMHPDRTIALDEPVTVDLPPLPLRDALALMLEEHELTFEPRGEVLYVTTRDDAEENLVTRIIDVRHLLEPANGGMDEDTLIELITTCVEPDMWDEVGGPGSQDVFRGLLVFRQTYDVSRQVQELIDAISEHCLTPPWEEGGVANAAPPSVWVGLSEREREIIARLDERDSLQVHGPKVEETIRMVCERHGIPVLFGRELFEFDDVRWRGTSLILDDAPLHAILGRLAGIRGGHIAVARGVLLVSGSEWTGLELLPRIYRPGKPSIDGQPLTLAQIEQLLTERIEPDTWDERGGYGVIQIVNDEWLLVVQTLPMHQRVEEALAKLRAGETLPMPPTIPPGSWDSLGSPAIGALWRLMRRMIPGAGAYEAE